MNREIENAVERETGNVSEKERERERDGKCVHASMGRPVGLRWTRAMT